MKRWLLLSTTLLTAACACNSDDGWPSSCEEDTCPEGSARVSDPDDSFASTWGAFIISRPQCETFCKPDPPCPKPAAAYVERDVLGTAETICKPSAGWEPIAPAEELDLSFGTFAHELAEPSELSGLEGARRLATADVDADGRRELLVMNHEGIHLQRPAAAGGLEPPEQLLAAASPRDPHLADLDGDGKDDLVFIASDVARPGVSIWAWVAPGDGDASFGAPQPLFEVSPGGTEPESALHLTDLDGDGRLDLLATNITRETLLVVAYGEASGSLTTPAAVELPELEEPAISATVGVGRFDGDTLPDLVVRRRDVVALFSRSGRKLETGETLLAPMGTSDLAVLDVDGNGVDDVVVTSGGDSSDGSLCPNACTMVFLGRGDGTFKAEEPAPAERLGPLVDQGDIDGDGLEDLLFVADVTSLGVALAYARAGGGSAFGIDGRASTLAIADAALLDTGPAGGGLSVIAISREGVGDLVYRTWEVQP